MNDLQEFYRYAVQRYTDHFPNPASRQLGQSDQPWDEADVLEIVSRFEFQTEYVARVVAEALRRGLLAEADAAEVYRAAAQGFRADVAAERAHRNL